MFPDARFLLYVRNPVDHVASLLKQDRIWDEIDREDPRQIEIIELTGHHEFGCRQIMANVGDAAVLKEIHELRDAGRTVRARARYWSYMYDFVLNQIASDPDLAKAVCIVRYEDLCGDSGTKRSTESFATPNSRPIRLPRHVKPTPRSCRCPTTTGRSSTRASLADIVEVTDAVARRFDYDVAAIADRAKPAQETSPA